MARKYTKEILERAVAESLSIAGVLRHLGVPQTGGGHAHISRTIKRMGIDTTHFTGQGWRRGRRFPPRQEPSHWLRVHSPDAARINGARLRNALLRIGRPYVCVTCGNSGTWLLRPLTLHVDHISGDYLDCRPENLRFLCPNCHAQTPTHAGRNKGRARRAPGDVGQQELSFDP